MPRLLTITFTTAVFWAEAAYGSLKPPPTRRLRRALLHLSYSTTISRLLDTTRSSNRTCRFPASGSRKRRTPSRTRHVTPSATSEHKPGAARLVVNPHVLCCFLRSSLPEVPSLHRHYPASLLVRTSPPPHTAQPVFHALPVDPTAITGGPSRMRLVSSAYLPLSLSRQVRGELVRSS